MHRLLESQTYSRESPSQASKLGGAFATEETVVGTKRGSLIDSAELDLKQAMGLNSAGPLPHSMGLCWPKQNWAFGGLSIVLSVDAVVCFTWF